MYKFSRLPLQIGLAISASTHLAIATFVMNQPFITKPHMLSQSIAVDIYHRGESTRPTYSKAIPAIKNTSKSRSPDLTTRLETRSIEVRPESRSDVSQPSESEDSRQVFVSELRSAIESRKEYPSLARSRRQTGRVEIGFELRKNGDLTDVRIIKPCAFDGLNQAALATVRNLGTFKPIPENFAISQWSLVLPIEFRIDD